MYKRNPARTSTTRLATGLAVTNVKLPKLELPTFCGDYKYWTSFFDHFNGAVKSNSQITESQKLQYLKTSVKGEASKLLTSAQITGANFSTVCNIQNNRYYSKRLTLQANVYAIVSQKPVTNENTKSFRDLMETVKEHILALSLESPWTIRTSFSCTSLQRNCPSKWEIVRKFHHQEETPNAILIWKSSWKKEQAPVKQSNSSHRQPLTRSLQVAHKFENLILLYPHLWLQRVNVATKTTNFVCAKVSKHFQYRTGLSWSKQKDFASTAYALDIEVNNAMDQLVRIANECISVFCTWKPITTRGQLQQRQQIQPAARHHKKQAIKQRKQ